VPYGEWAMSIKTAEYRSLLLQSFLCGSDCTFTLLR
jgi:hypothetical protein